MHCIFPTFSRHMQRLPRIYPNHPIHSCFRLYFLFDTSWVETRPLNTLSLPSMCILCTTRYSTCFLRFPSRFILMFHVVRCNLATLFVKVLLHCWLLGFFYLCLEVFYYYYFIIAVSLYISFYFSYRAEVLSEVLLTSILLRFVT